MKTRKRTISAICMMLVGCLFYTGTSYAADFTGYVKSVNKPKIRMKDNVVANITPQNIEMISEIAESKEKNEINVVPNNILAKKDLYESIEKALFVYDNGKIAGVEVNSEIVEKIEPQMVQDIVGSDVVSNGDYVTILAYAQTEESNANELEGDIMGTGIASPMGYGYIYRNGKAKKTGSQYKDKNKFITSVAKGQKKKLSAVVTLSANRELGGEYYSASVTSGFKASVTFKSELEYNSKNMASGTNCRKFYMRSYKQNYKRTQSKINAKTNAVIGTKTAIIKCPSDCIEYSVDVKIS